MACSNCGKTTTPCGCKDGPFTTVPGCACAPDANCPVPQTCVEMIDTACVALNDYAITDTGIPEGATMAQMMQMISLFLTNPNCISPNSLTPCRSVPYVYPYQITSSSIAIAWAASSTATSYQVEYQHISQVTWTQLPFQFTPTPNTAVISPLLPNSTYFVRVQAFCTVLGGPCQSITLRINTKP